MPPGDLHTLREHDILWLEVCVDDLPLRVQVVQGHQGLLDEAAHHRNGDAPAAFKAPGRVQLGRAGHTSGAQEMHLERD